MGRTKGLQIHPILEPTYVLAAFGSQCREALCLGFRHKQRLVEIKRNPTLERKKCSSLSPIKSAHWPMMMGHIGTPFLGIDIDHIEDTNTIRHCSRVPGHRGRKHEYPINRVLRERLRDPAMQFSTVEKIKRERAAGPHFCKRTCLLD